MRELVMASIAVLLVYLLWLVLRWARLARKSASKKKNPLEYREPLIPPTAPDPAPTQAPRGIDILADDDDEADDETDRRPAANDAIVNVYAKPQAPSEPDASSFGFDALLEVRQSRHLVDSLSQELAALKQEVHQLRQDLADLRAASRVSPQYGEAVALARRGLDASAIAERCGISVAEAELVRSLLAMSPSGE